MACLYKKVLKLDKTTFTLPSRPRIKKFPQILSVEEVKRLFESVASLKHRVLLKTIYSAGLRVGEAIKLEPRYIESDPSRMMSRIEQSKGKKDRHTLLSKHLLDSSRKFMFRD